MSARTPSRSSPSSSTTFFSALHAKYFGTKEKKDLSTLFLTNAFLFSVSVVGLVLFSADIGDAVIGPPIEFAAPPPLGL